RCLLIAMSCAIASVSPCIPMRPTDEGIPAAKPCMPQIIVAKRSDLGQFDGILTEVSTAVTATTMSCTNGLNLCFLDNSGAGGAKRVADKAVTAQCVNGIWKGKRPDGTIFNLGDPPNPFLPPTYVACENP
ncbi:hypothetical protein PENTCL1PPCAC_20783, partial [Pristionchus entomophagus]